MSRAGRRASGALVVLALLLASCGVKRAPRPPEPSAAAVGTSTTSP